MRTPPGSRAINILHVRLSQRPSCSSVMFVNGLLRSAFVAHPCRQGQRAIFCNPSTRHLKGCGYANGPRRNHGQSLVWSWLSNCALRSCLQDATASGLIFWKGCTCLKIPRKGVSHRAVKAWKQNSLEDHGPQSCFSLGYVHTTKNLESLWLSLIVRYHLLGHSSSGCYPHHRVGRNFQFNHRSSWFCYQERCSVQESETSPVQSYKSPMSPNTLNTEP